MREEVEPGIPQPRKVKWIVAGILFAILVIMAVSARPAWRLVKEWRAVNLSKEAMVHLENDSLENAWEKAQSAYALFTENEDVTRTVAEVTMRADPAMAVDFWEETYALSGRRDDLEHLVEAATLGRKFKVADQYMAELLKLDPQDGKILLLEAQLRVAQQDIAGATKAARQALKSQNIPEAAHFLYVQLTQFSDDPTVRQEGIDYLRALSQRDDELGLHALQNLSNYTANTPEELEDVIAKLRNHPRAQHSDQLLALRLEMFLPDANAEENLESAKAIIDLESPEQLIELGRWLNQQRRFGQTLQVISQEQAYSRKDLFLIWLDALAVLDQWEVINQALADDNTPIDRYLRLLFQARYYMETGQTARAEFAWSRAVLQVANDPQKLWFLTRYAQKLGLYLEAKESLDRLTTLPSSRRKAFEELVRLEQRDGSVLELRNRLQTMHEAYPNDTAVENDLAYANLLLSQNISESLLTAERLINEGSPYLANRVTLALAYYRQGRALDAATVLDTLPVDWGQARSGWRAVYAAILRANGRSDEANALIATIDEEALLLEERDLLGKGQG